MSSKKKIMDLGSGDHTISTQGRHNPARRKSIQFDPKGLKDLGMFRLITTISEATNDSVKASNSLAELVDDFLFSNWEFLNLGQGLEQYFNKKLKPSLILLASSKSVSYQTFLLCMRILPHLDPEFDKKPPFSDSEKMKRRLVKKMMFALDEKVSEDLIGRALDTCSSLCRTPSWSQELLQNGIENHILNLAQENIQSKKIAWLISSMIHLPLFPRSSISNTSSSEIDVVFLSEVSILESLGPSLSSILEREAVTDPAFHFSLLQHIPLTELPVNKKTNMIVLKVLSFIFPSLASSILHPESEEVKIQALKMTNHLLLHFDECLPLLRECGVLASVLHHLADFSEEGGDKDKESESKGKGQERFLLLDMALKVTLALIVGKRDGKGYEIAIEDGFLPKIVPWIKKGIPSAFEAVSELLNFMYMDETLSEGSVDSLLASGLLSAYAFNIVSAHPWRKPAQLKQILDFLRVVRLMSTQKVVEVARHVVESMTLKKFLALRTEQPPLPKYRARILRYFRGGTESLKDIIGDQ